MKMLILMLVALTVEAVQGNQPDVTVTPSQSTKNLGENFHAACNFPGIDLMDMVNTYPVQWFKSDVVLSTLSLKQVDDDRLNVTVQSDPGNARNLTAFITIKQLQYSDAGTYRCVVKDREDSVELKLRQPIQSMRFYLDGARGAPEIAYDGPGSDTTINFRTMGSFRPICVAKGAYPDPTIDIYFKGNKLPSGSTSSSMEKSAIGQPIQLSFKDDRSILRCSASVPGLSTSRQIDLTFNMDFPIYNPVFRCDNSTASVGKEQHAIECNVSNIDNLACSKLVWERMDTGEKFQSGSTGKITVTCFTQGQNSATTRLTLDKVTNAHFKSEWSIQYEFEQGLSSNRYITKIIQITSAAKSVCTVTVTYMISMILTFIFIWI